MLVAWFGSNCSMEIANGQSDFANQQVVAVLDIARVFKENKSFNAEMAELKEEVLAAKKEASEGGDAVGELVERRIRWQEKEATIYAETYTKIQAVVHQLAEKHGIALVIRADTTMDFVSSAEVQKDDGELSEKATDWNGLSRAEVIKRINSSVIYHRRLDLTNMVIKALGKDRGSHVTEKRCEHCGQVLKAESQRK
jgi:Skp family chaperone for outer membrane proteins